MNVKCDDCFLETYSVILNMRADSLAMQLFEDVQSTLAQLRS